MSKEFDLILQERDFLREENKILRKTLTSLLSLSRKLCNCFPENIEEEEQKFNLPRYVIDEVLDAIKDAETVL
jgi:hypothetical protein